MSLISESEYQLNGLTGVPSPDCAAVSVCRRCLPGLADGAVGGILCATLQFLPHTREFWPKGKVCFLFSLSIIFFIREQFCVYRNTQSLAVCLKSSTEYVGFLTQTCLFSTVHRLLMGFKSGHWEDHSKTSILAWFSHSFTTFDACLG